MAAKAFLFDMDGVLINTERLWEKYGDKALLQLFGKEILEKIGCMIGMSINAVYEKAVSYGATIDYQEYLRLYNEKAAFIYSKASVTEGVERLAKELISLDFKLGLVSSSPKEWIDYLLPKLSFRDKLEVIIALNDRPDLKSKPEPDGYLEALTILKADPELSIILEDSNLGIQAAKASGAYVIGFKGNLLQGYVQQGADICAETMDEVIELVRRERN